MTAPENKRIFNVYKNPRECLHCGRNFNKSQGDGKHIDYCSSSCFARAKTHKDRIDRLKKENEQKLEGIFQFYGEGCMLCGERDKCELQLHHIKPRNEGGDDSVENLALVCRRCHRLIHKMIGRDRHTTRLFNLEKRVGYLDDTLYELIERIKNLRSDIEVIHSTIDEVNAFMKYSLFKDGIKKEQIEKISWGDYDDLLSKEDDEDDSKT